MERGKQAGEIARLKGEWASLQPLAPNDERRLWKKLRLEWNYNSNHIEGNTLTYGETELLLVHGKTSGSHDVREYEEMKAHDVAIDHVRELAGEGRFITESDIRNLNRVILKEPFWKEALTADGEPTRKEVVPGEYKTSPNNVRTATGEMFEFASPLETPAKMEELVEWLGDGQELSGAEFLEHCADFHHRFVVIHPFDDGNGRVARLVTNYLLLRAGYVPIVVKSSDKRNYLTSLQHGDVGDPEPFRRYVRARVFSALVLGIRAAKGESIEEPDDLDKEVSLFVELQNKEAHDVAIPAARLKALAVHGLLPLFEAVADRLAVVDGLFDSVTKRVMYRGKGYKVSDDLWLDRVGEEGGAGPIQLEIVLNGYNKRAPEPFGLVTKVAVSFDADHFLINYGPTLSKGYDELLTEEEISAISRHALSDTYRQITHRSGEG